MTEPQHIDMARLAQLEQRVQALEDVNAIRHLKARYAAYCDDQYNPCLLYTSPSPRDVEESRMPSSA